MLIDKGPFIFVAMLSVLGSAALLVILVLYFIYEFKQREIW